MATIENIGNAKITIAGEKLLPGGTMEVHGKIPNSLRNLERVKALKITGADEDNSEPTKLVVDDVTNPKQAKVEEKSQDQIDSETDSKIIEIMKSLPKESLMGDGRPEVRAVNDKLKEIGLNNITADDRDRIWELVNKE